MERVLVGGCRAHHGGLHLGHVYGCFTGAETSGDERYVFVISDCTDPYGADTERSTMEICLDVLALGINRPVFVRESRIRPALTPLTTLAERLLPLRMLEQAHPHRRQVKAGSYRGSVGDFTFPVHQASYLLGLGCTLACYNDDNANVVSLAREIARRVNKASGGYALFPDLELPRRSPGRLLGADGRRMYKSNRNFLRLSSDEAATRRYIRRTLGRAVPPGVDVDTAPMPDSDRGYLQLLHLPEASVAALPGRDRIRVVEEALVAMLHGFQRRRMEVAASAGPRGVTDRLAAGEHLVSELIQDRVRQVLSRA